MSTRTSEHATDGATVDGITFQFNKDELAKSCESIQKASFMYTGKAPPVGIRMETQAEVHGAGWARFSGLITTVHDPPTKSSKYFCTFCSKNHKFACAKIVRGFGAQHGQRLTGRAILNFDFYRKVQ